MTPAITPVPPDVFKKILEKHGFCVELESELNWTLFKKGIPNPVVVLPKQGDLISLEIMMKILDQQKIDNRTYFNLLTQVSN